MSVSLDHEAFALRDGEVMQLFKALTPRTEIAVMIRSVEPPPGSRSSQRACDGAPVVNGAVLAALWSREHKAWQWLQLAPATKEVIGDYMLDKAAVDFDRWYYLEISRVSEADND